MSRIFGGLAKLRTGHLKGQRLAEEEGRRRHIEDTESKRQSDLHTRQMEREILQQSLLKLNIDKANRELKDPNFTKRGLSVTEQKAARVEELMGPPHNLSLGDAVIRTRQEFGEISPRAASERNTRFNQTPEGIRRQTTSENLGAVQRQLDDVQQDMGRAEIGLGKRPDFFPTPKDSLDFEARSGAVEGLRARRDSLGGVRDSLSSELIRPGSGRNSQRGTRQPPPFGETGFTTMPPTTVMAQPPGGVRATGMQAELDRARKAFEGSAQSVSDKATYDRIVAAIRAKYGGR